MYLEHFKVGERLLHLIVQKQVRLIEGTSGGTNTDLTIDTVNKHLSLKMTQNVFMDDDDSGQNLHRHGYLKIKLMFLRQ